MPWWVVGAAALVVLALTFTVYYTLLGNRAAPIQAELATIGLEEFALPAPPVPVAGPTLRQLLASDVAAGSLTIEENGSQTVVTPVGADLFKSGSAEINPAYDAILQRIAQALNKVPGRVAVVGHTDDQRIRSLQYQDNAVLSRARADSVVAFLQRSIDSPARLTATGMGSSQPRYRPESTPENRSRNRRVEIMHRPGA